MARIRDDGAFQPLRMVEQQPEPDHAAHGKAAEVGLFDAERIEDADRVGNQHVERVIAVGRGRSAVTSRVVAQHAIAPRKRIGELVPHRQVGRQAVAEHHPGATTAVDSAMKGRSVALDLHMDLAPIAVVHRDDDAILSDAEFRLRL